MRTLIERIAAGETTAEDAALVQAVFEKAGNMRTGTTKDSKITVDFDDFFALMEALDNAEGATAL